MPGQGFSRLTFSGQMSYQRLRQAPPRGAAAALRDRYTHYEAMKEADFDRQSDWEQQVTEMVNATGSGSFGLRGSVTALGCFIKVGPQRASGQRMVWMHPGCSVDIRRATVVLTAQDLRETA